MLTLENKKSLMRFVCITASGLCLGAGTNLFLINFFRDPMYFISGCWSEPHGYIQWIGDNLLCSVLLVGSMFAASIYACMLK